MKPSQPTLPGVRDWTQPVEIRSGELGALVIEAADAGFEAIRMKVIPGGYLVTFAPMTAGNTAKPPRRTFASYAELSQPKERD